MAKKPIDDEDADWSAIGYVLAQIEKAMRSKKSPSYVVISKALWDTGILESFYTVDGGILGLRDIEVDDNTAFFGFFYKKPSSSDIKKLEKFYLKKQGDDWYMDYAEGRKQC